VDDPDSVSQCYLVYMGILEWRDIQGGEKNLTTVRRFSQHVTDGRTDRESQAAGCIA